MNCELEKIAEKYRIYAKENGFGLNPDKKILEETLRGLIENEKKHGKKYCPCRRVTGDRKEDKKIICPCVYHKKEIEEKGHCLCQLFVRGCKTQLPRNGK